MKQAELPLAIACAWNLCGARATHERWDPWIGLYRPACDTHSAVSPFDLRPLQTPADMAPDAK